MKNIYVLPTDKPSRLSILNSGKLNFGAEFISSSNSKAQNIYITSDEEIKEGDWGLSKLNEIIKFHSGYDYRYYSKIILATDQDLIKDGVQSIDDEFLEWFVKNPSCEEVEVKKEYITPLGDIVETCYDNERLNYKIINPEEEPTQESVFENAKLSLKKYLFDNKEKVAKDLEQMREWSNTDKQDPLEHAAKEYAEMHLDVSGTLGNYLVKAVFQDGAQWQQERMYSEEEKELMIKIFHSYWFENNHEHEDNLEEWKLSKKLLEQFKKK